MIENRLWRQAGALTALGLAMLVLAACATPVTYGPKAPGTSVGYTDEQLGPNRYRVTYSGNSVTSRETVEDFLLRRAAEVTLNSGFHYFLFDTRDTKAHTTYYSSFDGPPWWHGYGWYWHSWAFPPDPFGDDSESRPITRFQAYAEIVMLTEDQAKAEPRAVDAKAILDKLAPPPPPPGAPPPPSSGH